MLRSHVPAQAEGCNLVDWLADRFRYFDTVGWKGQVDAGRIERNGARATSGDVLAMGDVVCFTPAPAATLRTPVRILYADADLVAVDKPAHLVAHAHGAFPQHTFLAEVAQRCGAGELSFVHRLDRETSGVLLLARRALANRHLTQQFTAGEVHKHYLAVVHGRLAAGVRTVDAAIGPAPDSTVPVRRAVVPATIAGARAARTEITTLQRFAAHTLLAVQPRTGRTHQIRVHLDHLGHPLVGDKLYGQSDARYLDYVQHLKADGDPCWPGRLPTGRHMLHAERLAFVHPGSGEPIEVHAPMPDDMATFLASLEPAG